MHELGTVRYVIRTVEQICEEQKLTKVASVTLEIGEVSGILTDYLLDFWKWVTPKTRYLQGAQLKIKTVDAVTYCDDCRKTYPTVKYGKMCPFCKSEHTWLLAGNEYNILEMEAM